MSGEYTEHEEHVIQFLKSTQPVPRQEFYRQLANMPWKKDKTTVFQKRTLLATAVCAVMALSIWFIPPLRTIAQEIIDSLFHRTESDLTVFEYDASIETDTARISSVSFDSIDALERRYDIDVLAPSIVPPRYAFDQVTYDSSMQTIWLNYAQPLGRGLQITVYLPGSDLESWSTIGATAPIVQVEITTPRGVFIGEYVEGAWTIENDAIVPTPQAGGLVSQPAEWINDAAVRRLRWQENGWVYEITAMGGNGDLPERDLMLEDLIALAESFE